MNHQSRHHFPGNGSGMETAKRDDMFTALADAARDNPLPAALIGLGALWLFAGGSNTSLLGGHGRRSLLGTVAEGAGSVAQGAAHAAGQAAATVTSGVSGIAGTVSNAAGQVGDYVSGALQGSGALAQPDSRPSSPAGMMRQNLADLFERHPIALGIAGLALGAGVAASLPLTVTERDTLGEAGKAVRGRLSEAADQAKQFAGAMAEELHRHGPGDGPG